MKDKAQNVAGEAADQGRHVAGTAKDEAAAVAGEARDQLRSLLSEATGQLDEQSRTQQQRLAGTVRTFGDDLSDMSSERSGLASDLARQAADRARTLADQLEQREPRQLLDDVRTFARRRPGTFLFGALVAGVVAGRMTRSAQAVAGTSSNGAPDGEVSVTTTAPAPVVTGPATPAVTSETTTPGVTVPDELDPLRPGLDPGAEPPTPVVPPGQGTTFGGTRP